MAKTLESFAHFTAVAWFVVHNVLAPVSFVPFRASGVYARLNYTLHAACFAYLTFTVRKYRYCIGVTRRVSYTDTDIGQP
jgi:hypothetical protein